MESGQTASMICSLSSTVSWCSTKNRSVSRSREVSGTTVPSRRRSWEWSRTKPPNSYATAAERRPFSEVFTTIQSASKDFQPRMAKPTGAMTPPILPQLNRRCQHQQPANEIRKRRPRPIAAKIRGTAATLASCFLGSLAVAAPSLSLDPGFNPPHFAAASPAARALLLPDGKFLLYWGGNTLVDVPSAGALTRYFADGTLDT